MDSRLLKFNAMRDFGVEAGTAGEQEIHWGGNFFESVDGQGIEESLSFKVTVKPLPEERLEPLARLDLPGPGQAE